MTRDYMEREVARLALIRGAIKLSPDAPFTWASGYRMPIYNDNRLLLFRYEDRNCVTGHFQELLRNTEELDNIDIIAGTSTAGIPWGNALANFNKLYFVYVRDKPKDHGLKNQIEGIDSSKDLSDYKVLLIEDLISTGGSSARAVQAIRDANGTCNYCFSIFDYGLDKAREAFKALNPECKTESLLTYDTLLSVARETDYINNQQLEMLEEWRANPFGWGEIHGFPRLQK